MKSVTENKTNIEILKIFWYEEKKYCEQTSNKGFK